MKTFKKNSFVIWASKDSEGTFSHKGEVMSHANGIIEFRDSPTSGVMCVPEDEGTFRRIGKPRSWGNKTSAPSIVTTKRRTTTIAVKSGSTKKEQVIDMLAMHKPTCRKDAMKLIIDELSMTSAGASTYAAQTNKLLQLW